jgi:hypothetical protein
MPIQSFLFIPVIASSTFLSLPGIYFSALQAAILNRQGKPGDFLGFSATGLESGEMLRHCYTENRKYAALLVS